MNEPASKDEYLERMKANHRLSGSGLFGVTMHMPCPFCAAPDWKVYRIVEVEESLRDGDVTCQECGRTGCFIVERDDKGVGFELVQVDGPPPPAWFEPAPRRVEPTRRLP